MPTVAVTGADTAVGRALLQRLDADPQVTAILGIGCDEPPMPVARLELRTVDLRDTLLPVFLDGADVVVHCAFDPDPNHAEDAAFARNVAGARNLLAATAKVGARRLVVLSDGAVYGAHADNAVPLTEDARLRANPDHAPAHQALLIEELVSEWTDEHPAVDVVVLRPATVLGPGADGAAVRLLQVPRVLAVGGHAPPRQFVHVDDVASALHLAATGSLTGPYNVAAEGWLDAGEVAALLGHRTFVVGEAVVGAVTARLWRWKLSPVPAAAIPWAMYPTVLSADRLRQAGWAAAHSNREVLREFADEHGDHIALGTAVVRRRDLWLAGFGVAGLLAGLLLGRRRD